MLFNTHSGILFVARPAIIRLVPVHGLHIDVPLLQHSQSFFFIKGFTPVTILSARQFTHPENIAKRPNLIILVCRGSVGVSAKFLVFFALERGFVGFCDDGTQLGADFRAHWTSGEAALWGWLFGQIGTRVLASLHRGK
jgi:hypothetical protein